MSYGYTLLADSWPIARKPHRCIWCGQQIEAGEKYRRERSVYDGEMQNHAWHPECDEAATEEFRHGEQEFAPHENERPEKQVSAGVRASDAPSLPQLADSIEQVIPDILKSHPEHHGVLKAVARELRTYGVKETK